jgi:phenylacetate-CoA ligase
MSALIRLVEAAPRYISLLRSQYWPREKLIAHREQRLKSILTAAAKIPFYAARFATDSPVHEFAKLPVLAREDIPSLKRAVRSIYPPNTIFAHAITNGTSGTFTAYLFDNSHQRGRHAARARYLRANGWNPFQRSAWLAGARFLDRANDPGNQDLEFVSRLFAGVRFIPNSIDFEVLAKMLADLDPVFIYLFPSILEGLLDALEEKRLELRSLRRIFTGSEVLENQLRNRVRTKLGVEISDNYGSNEAFIGWECPAGKYHLNAEHVFVEIIGEDGREVLPGAIGKVLITTLENYMMPLIRYDIGDYAVATEELCSCGRTLPTIGRILGRGMNLFVMRDGRRIASWNLLNALTVFPRVQQLQIVQKAFDRICVRYAAETVIPTDQQAKMRADIASIMGPEVLVEYERVAGIPRSPGGKFMFMLSEISA